ncbi:hypothetical protein GCM10010470_34820 [Saccharopolyspora taberi]|uniref:DUF4239 domain-containing protein n=1 Tax=Saccharopolyspora taberi TaxID=60895 RepID=A0ABN3VFE1_9PSEU
MFFLLLLLVVLPALLVAGALLLGRRRKRTSAESDSDSLGFVGGVLNALFTVVLAFYVVFSWQTGDDIEKAATAEANALTDAHWQMSAAPEPAASTIRTLLTQYAARVADHEWPALDAGRADPGTDAILTSLRAEVIGLPADTELQKAAREQATQDVRLIDENHRERVDQATDDQFFTVILLIGTILGALLMVVFPLLVGISPTTANIASMALLTAVLGCTVFMSLELLHPLHGAFGADPDAFRIALESLGVPAPTGT